MTDVLTTAKGLTQQGIGSHINEWGAILNANLGLIDSALGGTLSKALSGSVTLTGTEASNTAYVFSGTLGGTTVVTFPSFYGLAIIQNTTNQTLSCGIGGGTFISISSGFTGIIWSDGVNFKSLIGTSQAVSHSATGGSDTLPANPAGFITINVQGTDRKIPFYST